MNIINAPQIFSVGWSIVKLVLNVSTLEKVRIRSDGGEDLLLCLAAGRQFRQHGAAATAGQHCCISMRIAQSEMQ